MVKHRASGRNLSYLCPFCSTKQPQLTTTAKRWTPARRPQLRSTDSLAASRCSRQLFSSQSESQAQVEAVSRSPPYSPILFDRNVHAATRLSSRRNLPIRDKLHRWVTENASNATAVIATGSVSRAQTKGFPNSMFLDQNDQEDNVDEDAEASEQLEFGQEDSYGGDVSLMPGDLFRIRLSGEKTQLAIVIGTVGTQTQYLLQNGSWQMTEKRQFPSMQIKSFVSTHEMEQLRPFLPQAPTKEIYASACQVRTLSTKGSMPLDVCRALIMRMNNVDEEADEFRRQNASKFKQLYNQISDPTSWMRYDLEELVRKKFGSELIEMSAGAQISIYEYLRSEHECIRVSRLRGAVRVIVFPQSLASVIEKVMSWARSYQDTAAQAVAGHNVSDKLRINPLASFIAKARRIILDSRQLRSPTTMGFLSPCKPRSSKVTASCSAEEFSDTDKSIIEFLWNTYVRCPRVPSAASAASKAIGALILRATGAYPRLVLDSKVGKLLLQELGCLDPWVDPASQFVTSAYSAVSLLKPCLDSKLNEQNALNDLKLEPGSKQIPFPDLFADARRDWADLKVFCIDGRFTRVADDAISIEESKEKPDHFWIRVHIAHPSAFVPFGHPFEQRAKYMGSSFYSVFGSEQSMPMDLVQTLSLDSNVPVLTCSTLLDPNGSIEDIVVEPAIVRNLTKLTSEAVSEVMGSTEAKHTTLNIGKKISSPHTENEHTSPAEILKLAKENLNDLKLFQKVLDRRWTAREAETTERLELHQTTHYWSSVRLSRDWIDLRHDRIFESHQSEADPSIQITTTRIPDFGSSFEDLTKRNIVAAAMVLASESFARWTHKRNIPIAYLGHTLAPGFPVSRLNQLQPHEPFIAPTLSMSTKPTKFLTLNCTHYGRFTSPLRRYVDMLNAYQIDQYLKMQHDGTINFGEAIKDDRGFPYSKNELDYYLRNNTAAQDIMVQENMSKNHWIFQALFRSFHFKEGYLPHIWDFEITNPVQTAGQISSQGEISGLLSPLGIKAKTVASAEGFENNAKFRQFLPVTIDLVDPESRVVTCRAVGPATDKPQHEIDFESLQQGSSG